MGLARLLTAEGYSAVKLVRSSSGLLEVPCCLPAVEAVVTDFSHVNAYREELGDSPFDGVLGSDILAARAAVLDYGALTLYLQQGEQRRPEGVTCSSLRIS
jgi:hypothetical protein